MATNVRTFATGDYILCASGGTDSGYGTYLAVYKRNSTTFNALLSADAAAGNDGVSTLIEDTAGGQELYWYNGTAGSGSGANVVIVNADNWVIAAATKATGTVAPRLHRCVLSGPTWMHADGSTSLANGGAGTGWRLGGWFDGSGFTTAVGDIYCIARWNANALSDGTLEGFTSIAAVIAATPTNLWILNQASTATAVTDYMGTAATESSKVGTSVTSGVTIPNFDTTLPGGGPIVPSRSLLWVGS